MKCMEPKVVFGAVSAFSAKALIRLRRRMRNSARQRDVVDGDRFDCIGECAKGGRPGRAVTNRAIPGPDTRYRTRAEHLVATRNRPATSTAGP